MKKRMRFELLLRYLFRGADVAAEPEMAPEVTRVYSDVLADPAGVFCKSHEAVAVAKSIVAEKDLQAQKMLDGFDGVYCGTRSVVLAILPAAQLPDTLKKQPTQTEVVHAIETLSSMIQSHAGAAWADELISGRFGTAAPKMLVALSDLDAAHNALAKARQQRADAYMPAYGGYLAFKRVVRDVLGPSSRQYRKLHPRKSVSQEIEAAEEVPDTPAEEAAPDSGMTLAGNGTPALAREPKSVKVA